MADKVRHGLNVRPAEHFWYQSVGDTARCVECDDRGKLNSHGLCIDCRNDPAVRDEYLKD